MLLRGILITIFGLASWSLPGQCPSILGAEVLGADNMPLKSSYCKGDRIHLTLTGSKFDHNHILEWHFSDDPNFTPSAVTLGETIEFENNAQQCDANSCPSVLGILVDGYGDEWNEYVAIHSGTNGFYVDDLAIDFDAGNNAICPDHCGDLGSDCNFMPLPTVNISGCSNIFKVGPGDYIPPNANVVVFTSASANNMFTVPAGFCGLTDIYVLQSDCPRTFGAFTNKQGNGTKTTVFSFCTNCSQTVSYDPKDLLLGTDGDAVDGTGKAVQATNAISFVGSPLPIVQEIELDDTYCGMSPVYFKAKIIGGGCNLIIDPLTYNPNAYLQTLSCPEVEILGDAELCVGERTTLATNQPTWTHKWSEGNSNLQTISVGRSGTYKVTVTDNNGCTATDEFQLNVFSIPEPEINAIPGDTICRDGTAIIQASGGSQYLWSTGQTTATISPTISADSIFSVTIFNGSQARCAADTSITIRANDETDCQSADCPFVELPSIRDTICWDQPADTLNLDTTGMAPGQWHWSGMGIIDSLVGIFDPQIAGPGFHSITITYTLDTCTYQLLDTIWVWQPQLTLDVPEFLCIDLKVDSFEVDLKLSGLPPYEILYALDEDLQSPLITSDTSYTLKIGNQQVDSLISFYTYHDSICTGTIEGNRMIRISPNISFSTREVSCATDSSYVVEFTFRGDPSMSYQVFGYSGDLRDSLFKSDPIPSGQDVLFKVISTKFTLCDTLVIPVSSRNCQCITYAGSFRYSFQDTILICQDQAVGQHEFIHNNDHVNDGNDELRFILHDGTKDTIGPNRHVTSRVPRFLTERISKNEPGIYYFHAVIGDGTVDGVDLSDECLSLSEPIIIKIVAPPAASIEGSSETCPGKAIDIPVNIAGTAPFDLEFLRNGLPLYVQAMTTNFSLTVFSGGPDTIELVGIDNHLCPGTASGIHIIDILAPDTSLVEDTVCEGDTLILDGIAFHENHLEELIRIPGGSFNGCDSVAQVKVSVAYPQFGEYIPVLCPGDSLVFNGTTYDWFKPFGTEVLPKAAMNGCDSIVEVGVLFEEIRVDTIPFIICIGEDLILQDDTFDINRREGMVIFPKANQYGCDSLIWVKLSFQDTIKSFFTDIVCPGDTFYIGSESFHSNRLTGEVLLSGAAGNGCDSLVIVSLLQGQPNTGQQLYTICEDDTLYLQDLVLFRGNQTGQLVLPDAAANGCDSLVNVQLNFYPSIVSDFQPFICTGDTFYVGEEAFHAGRLEGQVTIENASSQGCDSIVQVMANVYPPATGNHPLAICADDTVQIGEEFFHANKLSGEVILNGASSRGCDSILNVQVQILPPAESSYQQAICKQDTLTLGGELFHSSRLNGVVVMENASYQGCDSIINVSLSLIESVITVWNHTLCVGDSLSVNGILFHQGYKTDTLVYQNATLNGCDSIVHVNVDFYEPDTGKLVMDACLGTEVVFNGTTYSEENPTGTETLTGAAYLGCDSIVEVSIRFMEAVEEYISLDLCAGDFIVVDSLVFDEQNSQGMVVLANQSRQGCDSIVHVSLTYHEPTTGNLNLVLCPDQSMNINGTNYGTQNPNGTEVLIGMNQYGCDSIVEINLSFDSINVIAQDLYSGCGETRKQSVQIDQIINGSPPYLIYILEDTFQAPALPFVIPIPDSIENLLLTVVDVSGCTTQRNVIFEKETGISIDLGPDTTINMGQSVHINYESNFSVTSYTLVGSSNGICSDCLPMTITPLKSEKYQIIAKDDSGCQVEAELNIIVEDAYRVFVPNIFSPNLDGRNDFFRLYPSSNLEQIHMFRIFTNWGELVFESLDFFPDDSQKTWDGTFKGQRLAPSVLTYIIEASFIDGQRRFLSGSITLIR